MSFPLKAYSSLVSMFTLENLFEEGSDRYYVVKDAIENISETFEKNVSEPVCAYWERMPENIAIPLLASVAFSFMLGFMCGQDFTVISQPSPEAQYAEMINCFTAGFESALFAGALCLVNAAVRPIFNQYFPRNWNTLRLIAEVAVTVTVVGVPAYFLCAGSPRSVAKLAQMLIFSPLIRIVFLGFLPQKDNTQVPEGATVSHQTTASLWISFYFGPPLI